ncbi:MAG: mannose-1-phosphate guanylyltransferase [Bacteroidales bacterium]|nr:mannose-1-phosphate guanylyltransferase [Bacteroidales bacterium]
MNHNYCVIMAGGIGSRFWPLSRTNYPKQFIDILGTGKSLIQQTYDRFLSHVPKENFLVVTNDLYKNLVLEQLPELTTEQVLLEPFRRNTAPCIEYANQLIQRKDSKANIVVTPADHLVLNTEEFKRILGQGFEFVNNNDSLLTIGIKPSRPDTGYGYIQKDNDSPTEVNELFKVKTFTEKPNLELARFFLESGEFSWNSGIFLWSLESIQQAFYKYLPDVIQLFDEHKLSYGTANEKDAVNAIYAKCENISIDYGIMEKSKNVFVLFGDFGWSDLGTWGSLYANSDKDQNQNVINGENIFLYETSNSIINVPKKKIVVAQGLEDYIIVESNDTLLICKKDEEQHIKQFVQDVVVKLGDKII